MTDDAAAVPRLCEPPAHLITLAIEASVCSPCRSKRGAVIFRGPDLVAWGYNDKPHGFACDGSVSCKATCRAEAIHAEQQALLSAGRKANGAEMLHVKTVDGELVPSGGPSCVQCSKLGLIAGIQAMWLFHDDGWRRYDTTEWHRLSLEAMPADLLSTVERLTQERDQCRAELEQERHVSLNDPAEQRAERYASEAAELTRRLIAAESEVARLTQEQAQHQDMERVFREDFLPFIEWGQQHLDGGRWGGHHITDAIKTELLEAESALTDLRRRLRALEQDMRKLRNRLFKESSDISQQAPRYDMAGWLEEEGTRVERWADRLAALQTDEGTQG